MGAQIFALLNFKGGVGKTTDAVNISWILAHHDLFPSTRVLVVDLDPQSNTSFWLLGRQRWTECDRQKLTTERLFKQHLEGHSPAAISPQLVQSVSPDLPDDRAFDIIPCSMETIHRASDPNLHLQARSQFVLASALEPLKENYDYIFIDCGPSYNILTENALLAAHHQLVPWTPDYLALEGVKWLGKLTRRLEASARGRPVAQPLGIIVNAFAAHLHAASDAMDELRATVAALQDGGFFPPHTRIFEPPIRRATKVAEATLLQRPLLDFAPGEPVTRDFIDLTHAIVRAVESL